jgi:hypothetical protein
MSMLKRLIMNILEKQIDDIQIVTLGGRVDAYSSNDVER